MKEKKLNIIDKYKQDLESGEKKFQKFCETKEYRDYLEKLENAIYDKFKIKRK